MESRRFFLWLSWWTKLFVSKLGCTSAVWDEKWPDFGTRIQQQICSRGIWDSLRYSVDIVGFQSVELSCFRWKNAVMPLVSRGGLFIYCFHVCIWTKKSSDRFFAFFAHLFKRWLFGIRESHQNPRQIHPTLGGLDWFNATWIGRKPLEEHLSPPINMEVTYMGVLYLQ